MSSEASQYQLSYSQLSSPNIFDTTDKNICKPTFPGSESFIHTLPDNQKTIPGNPTPLSPSKRRRASRTTSPPFGRSRRKGSTGTLTPCCTPTNSPEKLKTGQSTPKERSTRRSNSISGGQQRLRAPGSPPTPYATGRGLDVQNQLQHDDSDFSSRVDPCFGISKLNLNLDQATKMSQDLAAATYFPEEHESTGANGPRFFGGLEERQKRYRELNQARIRNWERFYGDMDDKREGGGVKGGCTVGGLVKLRGGMIPGSEDNLPIGEDIEVRADENEKGEQSEMDRGMLVPVKFILDA